MKKLPLHVVCRTYLLLAILAATVLTPLPYSPLALILLLLTLFTVFRPLPPRLSIAITITTIFLLPLILGPLLNYLTYATPLPLTALHLITAMTILPAIYLLDCALREYAPDVTPDDNTKQRSITSLCRNIAICLLVLLLISLALGYRILFFTSIILALYLLLTLLRGFRAITKQPLELPTTQKRIVAGITADVFLGAASKASTRLHCRLNPIDPWVRITPQRFTIDRTKIPLNLTITPPLAGTSRPQLQVSVIGSRGLIQVNQITQPVELHVIPRASYAEWLAIKYLEQAGIGASTTATLPLEEVLIPKRGVDYFGNRAYQYGDRLRDVDWKHTLKLGQLIIKEYAEAGEQAAIIAVNLSVTDAEEADKLAFNLITTALTLARHTIPAALAAYNDEVPILTTAVTDPRETLIQALLLVRDINPAEFAQRCLHPPDIRRLKRNITHLKRATSEPAQRLLSMLDFEYRAIEQAAKNHPATIALSQVARHVPPPAIIVVVSQMNHDAEAMLVATDKLTRRGFTTIRIEEPAKS